MAGAWAMGFDEGVTWEERAVIERLAEPFRNAFLGRLVRWRADGCAGGRVLVAIATDGQGERLALFRPTELMTVEDFDEFQLQIITGQRGGS